MWGRMASCAAVANRRCSRSRGQRADSQSARSLTSRPTALCHDSSRMKILVTGGAGFIGSCFVRLALQTSSVEIANLDKLTYAGNPENVASVADNPKYRFIKG